MLNVRLDQETEAYLTEILQREDTTPEELIKTLIHQRWITLQPNKTVVERLGGHPKQLLQHAPQNLSEREHRKRAIAEYLTKRHSQQLFQ
jgi:hypothetical protein